MYSQISAFDTLLDNNIHLRSLEQDTLIIQGYVLDLLLSENITNLW